MSETLDRLYNLLPTVYRLQDAERGYPLRAVLQVIAEQVEVVQNDISQLYENWFIETCEDWVVPYLGDLLGYKPVHPAGEPGPGLQDRQRNKILIPRREVANTIRYRRRKGTLALLEQLAQDVANWPARAVEFYKLLALNQPINHYHPERGRLVDVREMEALLNIDGSFDSLAHTVDIRGINSHRSRGRYNIPSVDLFLWRLKAYKWTYTQAYCLEQIAPQYYSFSPLGNDSPLYNRPQPEASPTDIAGELNLPVPIRRRILEKDLKAVQSGQKAASDYYGPDKSLQIWVGRQQARGNIVRQPVPSDQLIVADLSEWQYRTPQGKVALDPELGRISFPPGFASQLPAGVWVSFHYAFSADMGGGEYPRPLEQPDLYDFFQVREGQSIQDIINGWTQNESALPNAVIEIVDSGIYTEQLAVNLAENQSMQIRAANGKHPVIRLLDKQVNRPDSFSVIGEKGSSFTLDGLLITGRAVRIEGELDEVNIRHCTLVPGWALHVDCTPRRPAEASLMLETVGTRVKIEHSILGSIQVSVDPVNNDPIPLQISDSILDATEPDLWALGTALPGFTPAHATLTIQRCTVIGEVLVQGIELAENSIFYGLVRVARRQRGCVRFCYVPPDSRTPRRYHCQPDLVDAAVAERFAAGGISSQEERDRIQANERLRVQPQFNSERYSTPTYCQLRDSCAIEIRQGADDESEMGVFHDLYQPQREANLLARLQEFTPAGMDAGIIFVN